MTSAIKVPVVIKLLDEGLLVSRLGRRMSQYGGVLMMAIKLLHLISLTLAVSFFIEKPRLTVAIRFGSRLLKTLTKLADPS